MSDIDGGSEVRVISVEGDAAEPDHGDPSTMPVSLSFPIIIYVRWSDGHLGSDAGAQVGTTPNPYLSWDSSTWRATAVVDGSQWEDDLFISYIDPCYYSFSFSAVVSIAIRHSAYEYNGIVPGLVFDQCLWRSTCTGSCSTSGYVTVKAHGSEPCFDPGQPYVQCSDVLVNGATCWRKIFCPNVPVPGYCN